LNLSKVGTLFNSGCFMVEGEKVYLAKAKENKANSPKINQKILPQSAPAFIGDMDNFLQVHNGDESLKRQMKNKVRKCPKCGKPVAFTLSNCNQCDNDITKVEIGYTNNVFSGFMYGIQKGPFPFTISLRYQDEEVMVFDDLLAMSPLHFNSIPGNCYMPDWRFLLKDPKKGLDLLNKLYDKCWDNAKSQFWDNLEWRKKFTKNCETAEDFKNTIICGFNYPPSQYQLHIQFMLPPLFPFQYYLYLNGKHYTPGRFFPIDYVRQILQLNETYAVTDDTPLDEILTYFKNKHGIDYESFHKKKYEEYGQGHLKAANWNPNDFEGVVFKNQFYKFDDDKLQSATLIPDENIATINANDKTILQNYGRPYVDNKPTGNYYTYAKKKENVVIW